MGLLTNLDLLMFLSKIPFLLTINVLLLIFGTLSFIAKDLKILLNPKGLVTLIVYYVILSLLVLVLIQIPLAIVIILLFNKTPSELFGGFPKGTIIYSILTIIIYRLGYALFEKLIPKLDIFDEETLKKIKTKMNQGFVFKLIIYIILLAIVYAILP